MNKRLSAIVLALALCLGLAIPAFAAGAPRDPLPSVSFDLPDGYTASAKTDTYQIRHFHTEIADGYGYHRNYIYDDEPTSEEITCTALPLGTGVTINGVSGISALPGEPAANGKIYYNYRITVGAYSDPDGDGVYDERIIYNDSAGTVDGWDIYSVVPASEKGPFTPPDNDDWSRYVTSVGVGHAGFKHYNSYNDTSVETTTSDILYELFGPNTLIWLKAELAGAADSEPEDFAWFLITDETAPPAMTVNVTDLDDNISKKDMEFTLRSITEEYFPDNRLSAIHTDFTRNEETETLKLKDIPILTERGFVNIRGIKAVSDTQEPWTRVNLYAWSDPDGDGVYDQQLFSCYWAADSVTMAPLSQPGPFTFREIDYHGGRLIYSRSVNLTGEGELTFRSYGSEDAPSSIVLKGNYLTWLFGPDTLVQIRPNTGKDYQRDSSGIEEGPSFYCYIPKEAVAAPAFTDVPEWCQDAVDWAVENKITTGTSYTTFAPGTNCTHVQILTFLWRAKNKPASTATLFSGLAGDYAPAANWAYEQKLIDDSFKPGTLCTRAQAVSYIWQVFEKPEAQAGTFPDVDAGSVYAAAISWAVENGIVEGYTDGTFRPNTICSRGVIATMLHRAYIPEARLTSK